MRPNGFDAARMKNTQRIDEKKIAEAPEPTQENERLILSSLKDPLPAVQETIKLGYAHEAGKGDMNSCQCGFLEHQLEHTDLSKEVPNYFQEAYDKIVADLPRDEVETLRAKYW